MKIKTAVTRSIGKAKFKFNQNIPHISFASGLIGVSISGVLACRQTLRNSSEIHGRINEVKAVADKRSGFDKLDVLYVTKEATKTLAKIYCTPALIGSASILLLTSSHVQMTRRNATLTLAYGSLHQAYSEYRERVKNELGEEKEREIYHGVSVEQVKNENGKLESIKNVDTSKLSPYARFFDQTSSNWQKNAEYNRLFLQGMQNFANNRLHAQGYLFLNEVYDMLGIERSLVGQIVGWAVGGEGDNYVDFGIFNYAQAKREIGNGLEPVILLDFNVDGSILNRI